MSADVLMQLIGTYGFPIVACIAMGWYVKDQTDKNRQELDKIQQQHRTEMKEVTEALNNNTTAIEKLCILIGSDRA